MPIYNTIKRILTGMDLHSKDVVNKSIYAVLIKIIGVCTGLFVSIFLGRLLGAEGLGLINLSNRVVEILIVLCMFGMRQVIIKEIAIAKSDNNNKQIGNVMFSAYMFNGLITTLISIVLIISTPFISKTVFHDERLVVPLLLFFLVLTPQVFSRIFSSALIGISKVWQSGLVEQTLSVVITGILLLNLVVLGFEIDIMNTALCYAIGRVFVTITVAIYWRSLYKNKLSNVLVIKRMLKTSLPLLSVETSAIFMSNFDVLIVGILFESVDVGIYTVSSRIALLSSFLLHITNSALSAKIAQLYYLGKLKDLEVMVRNVTTILFLIGLISLMIFSIFGQFILGLWNKEFVDGYYILIILSIGQFFNLSTGAVGLLLNLTGFERIQSKLSFVSIIFLVIVSLLFVKLFGVIGVAIGASLTISLHNLIKVVYTKKYLGITTLPYLKIF